MNAVVTLTIGRPYMKLGLVTHPTMLDYAFKIGADFHVISDRKYRTPIIPYEKLQLRGLLDRYERIVFFDTDLIVHPDTPDLFEMVPPSSYGAVDVAKHGVNWKCSVSQLLLVHAHELGIPAPPCDGRHPNTGVMVVSRCHAALFDDPPRFAQVALEQGWLNIRRLQLRLPFHPLPLQFNHGAYYGMDKPRRRSWIKHYQATLMGPEAAMKEARQDIAAWGKG